MTITSRTHPWRSASSTIRPSRGSTGSRARRATERRQPAAVIGRVGLERAELVQQGDAVADRPRVGRIEERERGHVAEAERGHLQDDRGQVRAQDLRLGELRPGGEVVLAVQADADAGGDAPAATGTLVGRRLRDRLDRQSLHLQPVAVAGDPRRAGVDDVAHAGHGERGLGDVGGQHDPAAGVRLEDAVLLGRRQAGVQRQHLACRAARGGASASAVSWISRSPLRNTSTSPGPRRASSSTASHTACT